MTKQITRVWSFASDSNPNVEYQTLQYADGTTSCNCKGWTRRVAAVNGTLSFLTIYLPDFGSDATLGDNGHGNRQSTSVPRPGRARICRVPSNARARYSMMWRPKPSPV